MDLHSSLRATKYNSYNLTLWTSATYVTSLFARARKAFNVTAAVTIRLVSRNKLKRIQRGVTRNIQAKLFASWEKYENNEKTAAQLLKTCSRLNGLARAN